MPDDRIKRPAYQWNVVDARSDEIYMLMTYEQRGIFRELLDQQWIEGSIPANPEHLAGLLKISSARFAKAWPLIAGKFRPRESDRLVNDRLEAYRRGLDSFVKNQAENGARGAAKRWARHSKPIATPMANDSTLTTTTTKTVAKEQQRVSPAEKAPGVKEFLTWFQGEYKARRNGAVYFVKWEAHGAIVKRLLTGHPVERLKKHAVILLRSNEPWIDSTDRGIEVLSGKINWLEERLCAWESEKKAREAV